MSTDIRPYGAISYDPDNYFASSKHLLKFQGSLNGHDQKTQEIQKSFEPYLSQIELDFSLHLRGRSEPTSYLRLNPNAKEDEQLAIDSRSGAIVHMALPKDKNLIDIIQKLTCVFEQRVSETNTKKFICRRKKQESWSFVFNSKEEKFKSPKLVFNGYRVSNRCTPSTLALVFKYDEIPVCTFIGDKKVHFLSRILDPERGMHPTKRRKLNSNVKPETQNSEEISLVKEEDVKKQLHMRIDKINDEKVLQRFLEIVDMLLTSQANNETIDKSVGTS